MSDSTRINEYANSMFRHEILHETWLRACAEYLVHVFGEGKICGRTVIDYAFGRGNWAVAFARCGAERVIAVDASEDNCRKLRAYCAENGITNVEVIQGNLDEHDLEIAGEILWLYGILHHMADRDAFLGRLLPKIDSEGEVLAYAYNAESLREWVVSATPNCALFESEADFLAASLLFSPQARLRAGDDLVAPHINWDTAAAFAARFARMGWYPKRQIGDFASWLREADGGEFNPYVVKFSRKDARFAIMEQADNPCDLSILRSFGETVVRKLPDSLRRSFAIGLFNTHFQNSSATASKGQAYAEQVAWEDFGYLVYAAVMLGASERDFPTEMAGVWEAAMCSARGNPRKIEGGAFDGSTIIERLSGTGMRL